MGNYRIVGWGGPCSWPASHILLSRGWLGGWAAGCLCGCQDTEYILTPFTPAPSFPPGAECSTLGREGTLWAFCSFPHGTSSVLFTPSSSAPLISNRTSQRVKEQGQTLNNCFMETINFSSPQLEPLQDHEALDRSSPWGAVG